MKSIKKTKLIIRYMENNEIEFFLKTKQNQFPMNKN